MKVLVCGGRDLMDKNYKVYIYGMDDVMAMPDLLTAFKCAQSFNENVIKNPIALNENAPLAWACVQYWEKEDGNHAEFVKHFNIKDWFK